jgi:hypothetical protein
MRDPKLVYSDGHQRKLEIAPGIRDGTTPLTNDFNSGASNGLL